MTPPRGENRRTTGRALREHGFSLLEALLALAIAAILLAGMAGVVGQSLQAWDATREHEALIQDASFAMERMVTAVSGTSRLLLPLAENPATAHSEAVRDMLAVALGPVLDRDRDGFADADNDRDGRVDEDSSGDATNDQASGIIGIDDDGDGVIDEDGTPDDDEDGTTGEDLLDGLDNDGDGAIDEDWNKDQNGDSLPGVGGVDDDGDGFIDEGGVTAKDNDDEDDADNEDWIDPVVFFLTGTTLVERLPNLDPADGLDFSERPIAENVSLFRVERLAPGPDDRAVLVELTLQLAAASGETVDLQTRVRVGGGS